MSFFMTAGQVSDYIGATAQHRWATQAEARQALFGYIEGYYNRHRMHSAIGYFTPEQAEQRMTG